MSEQKVDIGRFFTTVIFLRPEVTVSRSQERQTKYVGCCESLADLSNDDSHSLIDDNADTAMDKIVVTTWNNRNVTRDWRILYDCREYRITRIVRLENNLYARYECVNENVENE
ncbi:hypothetical protein Barb7_00094 [Bacteroidales bacterium Barb7]|nr:hypothetical protein Barb7_00094 [Bacteroidales bacterium Barb7]